MAIHHLSAARGSAERILVQPRRPVRPRSPSGPAWSVPRTWRYPSSVVSGFSPMRTSYAIHPASTTAEATIATRTRPVTTIHSAIGPAMCGLKSASPSATPLARRWASARRSDRNASAIDSTVNCSSVRVLVQQRNNSIGTAATNGSPRQTERTTRYARSGASTRPNAVQSGTSQGHVTIARGDNTTIAFGG